MKDSVFNRIAKQIPLETDINISVQLRAIILLKELGLREGSWTDSEEDIRLGKIIGKFSKELTEDIIEHIKCK